MLVYQRVCMFILQKYGFITLYICIWVYGFRYSLVVCILNIVTIYIVVISICSAILY